MQKKQSEIITNPGKTKVKITANEMGNNKVSFLATKTSLITGFISQALAAVAAATPAIQIRDKIIHFR